jgi:hypothetical protein
MTVTELARLVKEMRRCQRAYFRDRTQDDLDRSKAIEADVDRAVRDVLSGDHLQAGLFDGPPSPEAPSR